MLLSAVIGIGALAFAALPANAQSYQFYDLSSPDYTSTSTTGISLDVSGAQSVVGNGTSNVDNSQHALLWNDPTSAPTDLNGSLITSSAYGVSGTGANTVVVGYGIGQLTGGQSHALVWQGGTASSVFDLNPNGFDYSYATAVSGVSGSNSAEVGYGSSSLFTGGNTHALLWTGSTTTAIDLNPTDIPSINSSYANGVTGTGASTVVVGEGYDSNYESHALLWTGPSASSAVDLTGSLNGAYANGVYVSGGTTIAAGWGIESDYSDHALLWIGSGTSYTPIDLSPSGYANTYAEAIAGSGSNIWTVGYGVNSTTGDSDPLLWTGTSGQYIDLDSVLPAAFVAENTDIYAYGVDSNGDIVGVGVDSSGNDHPFELKGVPEPATVALLLGSGLLPTAGAIVRRRLSPTP